MTISPSFLLTHFYSKAQEEISTYKETQGVSLSFPRADRRSGLMFLAGLLLVLVSLSRLAIAAEDVLSTDIHSRAAQRNIQFSTLSISNGLSQATVNSIAQDQQGFIWIGTQEGLNRYDGYEFKVYLKHTAEPNSLSNDWVWTVFADTAGRLWIGQS